MFYVSCSLEGSSSSNLNTRGSCYICLLEDLSRGATEIRARFVWKRMRWGKIHFVYIYRPMTDIQKTAVEKRLSVISHVISVK
jgi:hypothetical protein